MSEENPWRTTASRVVYENPWISVREDAVITPRGRPGIYGVISAKAATGVVALTGNDEMYLVGQYRYPTEMYSWEIIEGGAETGETPLEAAKRELREEAGLVARLWEPLGSEVHLSNCFSAEVAHLFLAKDLEEVEKAPDETELLEVRRVTFSEALRMVDVGEVKDAVSIIGILRAARLFR